MGVNQKKMNRLLRKITCVCSIAVVSLILTTVNPAISVFAKSNEKPKIEFGIVPDVQYCDCDINGTRHYRSSVDKLKEAAKTINSQDVDFTVQTGDLIDKEVSSFSTILPIFNMIEGPKYHVLGNHDFPVPTDEVVDILGMSNQYYDFKYKNWRFVILDTNDLSFYANPVGSEKYLLAEKMHNEIKEAGLINAQRWNGGVSEEQLIWLKDVLNNAEKRQEKVVVFSHMPVYPENQHNVWNSEELMKVLEEKGNVVAYFNGHNHAGNYGFKNGIHYVNLQGVVETADTTAFSIVRIFKDHIELDGFGREQDRTLHIE